jgi:hypothetical protein
MTQLQHSPRTPYPLAFLLESGDYLGDEATLHTIRLDCLIPAAPRHEQVGGGERLGEGNVQ